MQRSRRSLLIKDAQIDFTRFWLGFMDKHDQLTAAELLNILSSELHSTINMCIKVEREEARNELRGPKSRRQEDGD